MKESSSVKTINAPVERVYATLSDLETLRPVLDRLANDEKVRAGMKARGRENLLDMLEGVVLTSDRMEIPVSAAGTLAVAIAEREENKCVKYKTEKSPVPATIWIQLLPQGQTQTAVKITVDADIPFFLKPMVGGKIKDGLEKAGDTLSMLNF